MPKPKHVMTTLIKTTPETLWEALTTPEMTRKYFFGLTISTDYAIGAEVTYTTPDGEVKLRGKLTEFTPQKKLAYSYISNIDADEIGDPDSLVTFEIEQLDDICKLTMIHDGFPSENQTYRNVGSGWPVILSGLKTLLETGAPLMPKTA